MGIKYCPKCYGKVSTSRNVCIHCGYVFPSSKKCPDCGESVDINVMECPVCGYLFNKAGLLMNHQNDVKETAVEEQKKPNIAESKIVVAIDEISSETEENNPETQKEVVVEEHNEVSDVLEEDVSVNNNIIVPVDDVIPTIVAEEAEKENNKSSVECPYCESKSLMPIGIEYYMCDTCKGRFLNTNGSGFTEPYVCSSKLSETVDTSSNATEVSISENAIAESHFKVETKSEESVENNADTISKFRKKPKDDEEHFESSKVKECNEKVSSSSGSNKKLWITITSIVAGLAVIFGILTGTVFVPKSHYDDALSLLNSDINEAIEILDKCSWGDSSNQAYFARARVEFNSKLFNSGIDYMHDGNGKVYVYYNTNGGSDVRSGFVSSNGITATSTKKGYIFSRWILSSYIFFSNNYKVDLYLSAEWTINSYSV